ncbi:MAG: hypothetical protein Q8878_08030 [Bacillota bacterium]|nr:hypothetical protein [Bacillota bacterium]
MTKGKEYALVYVTGAVLYSFIEILWRGSTHWTMAVTGGLCFLLLHLINIKLTKLSLFEKCLLGSLVITAVEFTVGCLVNLVLRWNVWDYSGYSFNILGQACLFYSFMWFLLSLPAYRLSTLIKDRISSRKPA